MVLSLKTHILAVMPVTPGRTKSAPQSQWISRARALESIVDIQETDTYTPTNRCSTDLLAGVVQHPDKQGRRGSRHALFQTVLSGDSQSSMRVIPIKFSSGVWPFSGIRYAESSFMP